MPGQRTRPNYGHPHVSKLLTHRSVTTTSEAYVHLDVEDLRSELVRAGAWDGVSC